MRGVGGAEDTIYTPGLGLRTLKWNNFISCKAALRITFKAEINMAGFPRIRIRLSWENSTLN